jgi:hypothetical protein
MLWGQPHFKYYPVFPRSIVILYWNRVALRIAGSDFETQALMKSDGHLIDRGGDTLYVFDTSFLAVIEKKRIERFCCIATSVIRFFNISDPHVAFPSQWPGNYADLCLPLY